MTPQQQHSKNKMIMMTKTIKKMKMKTMTMKKKKIMKKTGNQK